MLGAGRVKICFHLYTAHPSEFLHLKKGVRLPLKISENAPPRGTS